jgi:signal transduction histidine kinase
VDHMASDAAKDERRKLARSIHDRVIQPYLGLQIGLKALHQEFLQPLSVPDSNGSRARSVSLLEQLIGMTRDGIEELRQYVHGLKQSNASDTPLAESIRSFAQRFENATGVHVVVNDGACGLTMEDRLSVEIFQMTAEALSNVHRHTKSRIAQVSLRLVNSNLLLVVENEEAEDLPARQFRPRSISERADAIGARTDVLCSTGRTLVTVEVPL